MFKQSILAMALVIGIGYGCTQKTKKSNLQIMLQFLYHKNNLVVLWLPEERKDFWISLTFLNCHGIVYNKNAVRQAFLPETLFEISTCIVETMERRYDLETFERLNNDGTTTPEFVAEISGVSRKM